MNRFIFLSGLMAVCVSLQAQSVPYAGMSDETTAMKRNAERLRYELKRESDQRLAQLHTTSQSIESREDSKHHHITYQPAVPEHFSHMPALANDTPIYKERLDSIVSMDDSKQLFTYDDLGHMLTHEKQKWMNNAWVPQSLYERTYQSHYDWVTRIIEYEYVGTEYVPLTASFNNYFDVEHNRQITGYAYWNEEHQDWRFSYIQEILFDDQGRKIAYTFYTNWDDVTWQPIGIYEHYEVAYLPDNVVETTWFSSDGSELVPLERHRIQNDTEHRYTIMKETQLYANGVWNTLDYQKELREYYGDREWDYHTTYYESLTSYNASGKFDYGSKCSYAYDDHGNETLREEYYWDSYYQKWKGSSHYEHGYRYIYNEEWEHESYFTIRNVSLSGWNNEYNTWDYGYLSETDYDASNEWCYYAQATWSAEKKDWIYSSREKIDRTFDDEGRVTFVEQMAWNTETGEWKHPMISTSYEYAADGLVTMTQYNQWSEELNQWQDGSKKLTRQDEHGNIIYEYSYRWNASEQCFIPNSCKEVQYIYDENCNEFFMYDGHAEVYKIEYDNWSDEYDTWGIGKKVEMGYDGHYRLIHQRTSYWMPKHQEFYLDEELQQLFDENGHMTFYQLDRFTEDGNQDFEYHEKWTTLYDANNNIVESCAYEYNRAKAEFWISERSAYEYDLITSAQEVMGLYDLEYHKDKPLSSIYQRFSWTGNEIHHEERHFYYSPIGESGEGIGEVQAPVTVEVSNGRISLSSSLPADISIHSIDGKLIDSARHVCSYSLPLNGGTYVVVVNGVSRVMNL